MAGEVEVVCYLLEPRPWKKSRTPQLGIRSQLFWKLGFPYRLACGLVIGEGIFATGHVRLLWPGLWQILHFRDMIKANV